MRAPSLKTRLERLVARMGARATHGRRLRCGPCHYTWAGTDEACGELWPLRDRLGPYVARLTPSGGVCRDCGQDLWCRPCDEPQARQIPVPEALCTEAQLARATALLGPMRLTPR
jgi:hypothetical protein